MTSAASGILLAMFGVMMAVMFVIASPTATFLGLRYEQRILTYRYSQLDPLVRQTLADTHGNHEQAARKLCRKTHLPRTTIDTLLSLYTDHD